MSTRTVTRHDVEEFVAVCSPRLMQTAYLLTLDQSRAASLTEDALAAAALAWDRMDIQPERFVRERVLSAYLGWGVGRTSSAARERAVAVLSWWEGLTEEEVADELGCSVALVDSVVTRATTYTTPQQIKAAMAEQLRSWEPDPAPRVMDGVDRGVDALRVRRRVARAGVGVLVAALLGFTLTALPEAEPDSSGVDRSPSQIDESAPRLLRRHLETTVEHEGVPYVVDQIRETVPGGTALRAFFPSSRDPLLLRWATTPGLGSEVVVLVDQREVARAPAGGTGEGVVLEPGPSHVVVLRLTRPGPMSRIGLATYEAVG